MRSDTVLRLLTIGLVLFVHVMDADASEADRRAATSQPTPVMKATRIDHDFDLDGNVEKAVWKRATSVRVERRLKEAAMRPELSTVVRCLWSDQYLYLGYECPFTKMTTFDPPYPPGRKRMGLWDRDVVEAFIGTDEQKINHYAEFEVAPTNERLDLWVKLPDRDFDWTSRFESAVKLNTEAKTWTAEMRIPLAALSKTRPRAGTRWRLNLYRHDGASADFLAWNPTLTATAHTPERFGVLEFGE